MATDPFQLFDEWFAEARANEVNEPEAMAVATTGSDSVAKLWDVATLKEVSTLKGHAGAVKSLAFSPDGKRFLMVMEPARTADVS